MNIFKVLQERSKFFYVFLFLLAIINSTVYSGILFFITQVISNESFPIFPEYDWLMYVVLIVSALICSKLFQTYMVKITNSMLIEYELSVIRKLRFASVRDFEKIGGERVYTSIGDTRILSQLPEYLITGVNSLIIVICGMGYLFWVSVYAGLGILITMTILLVFYVLRNNEIEDDMNKTRDLQNHYYSYLRDLLDGFREVKMSISRNDAIYYDFIKKNRDKSKILSDRTSVKYVDNELIGNYSWYILLGVVMFVFPRFLEVNGFLTSTFIVTILYLIGPMANLILFIPFYTRVKIALERITELGEEVNAQVNEKLQHGDLTDINKEFNSIVFSGVTFKYFDQSSNSFQLGPLDLRINAGEVLFVTGGNGSGKSTFINVLTGLYNPTEGQIILNGTPITPQNISFFRNQISAIFTNNYMFSENYDGFDLSEVNPELQQHIEMMKLKGLIKYQDGKNHIDEKLSKGQQKRLALIYALMEDKQIIVLDEWAAEQDPDFRKYFYMEIIPFLKKQGKTLIVVTHDDFYFHCTDRLLKLDYGNIVSDKIIENSFKKERSDILI